MLSLPAVQFAWCKPASVSCQCPQPLYQSVCGEKNVRNHKIVHFARLCQASENFPKPFYENEATDRWNWLVSFIAYVMWVFFWFGRSWEDQGLTDKDMKEDRSCLQDTMTSCNRQMFWYGYMKMISLQWNISKVK